MRLVTSWVWNFFQADMAGGFLNWFAGNWVHIALALIIAGVVVDWLIWMIRWRPYWLWLRKRQIIYDEVEAPQKPRKAERPEPVRHMPKAVLQSEYDDPFASGEIDPYALAEAAPRRAPAKAEPEEDFWDAGDDPYAAVQESGSEIYARPDAADAKQPRRAPSGKRN